jgi:uncharacterized protein involved in exopolysaccharide biosynthesis
MGDLRRVGRFVRRWGGLLLLGALAGVVGAYVSSLRHTPAYVALATVEVVSAVTGDDHSLYDLDLAQTQAQTYLPQLRGLAVLADVIADTGMNRTPADLAGALTVERVPGTALINIRYHAADGESAAYLANKVAEVFIRRITTERRAAQAAARAGLEERLAANDTALQAALTRQAVLRDQISRPPGEQQELEQLAATVLDLELARAGLRGDLDTLRGLQALDAVPVRLVTRATAPPEPVAVRGVVGLGVAALGGLLAAALLLALLPYAVVPLRGGQPSAGGITPAVAPHPRKEIK